MAYRALTAFRKHGRDFNFRDPVPVHQMSLSAFAVRQLVEDGFIEEYDPDEPESEVPYSVEAKGSGYFDLAAAGESAKIRGKAKAIAWLEARGVVDPQL